MKLFSKLTIGLLVLVLVSCNTNEPLPISSYKFANETQVITCSDLNNNLFNEALYTFENDIYSYYRSGNSTLKGAYSLFLREVNRKEISYQDITSPHALKVLEALKLEPNLWDSNNQSFNYNAPVFKCVMENFPTQSLVKTINSLTVTNSVRPDILAPPFQKYIKNADKDKYFALFIAFNMYYEQIQDIDPALVTEKPIIVNTSKQ
ncbi:hypothetical protein ACW5R3_09970 [Bizionia sp. KMM 8389]